jgi:hypothetical protein
MCRERWLAFQRLRVHVAKEISTVSADDIIRCLQSEPLRAQVTVFPAQTSDPVAAHTIVVWREVA